MKQALDLKRIGEIADFLTKSEKGMKETVRWGRYYEAGLMRRQSSLDHTNDILWVTLLSVILVISKNYSELDQAQMLKLILLSLSHDYGEPKLNGGPGDIVFPDKQGNDNHKIQELKAFINTFDVFSPSFRKKILRYLVPVYLGQYNTIPGGALKVLRQGGGISPYKELYSYVPAEATLEANIFDAVEKMAYVINAYQAYKRYPKGGVYVLVKVLRGHSLTLYRYSKNIKGFDKFYSEKVHKNILSFLERNKDLSDADVIAERLIRIKKLALNKAMVAE